MTRQQRRYESRKGAREQGFQRVPNSLVATRHGFEVVRLMGLGVSAIEAEQQAWRNIAAMLPRPRMVRGHRPTRTSIATGNRHGGPHQHKREIARNTRPALNQGEAR